VSPLNLANIMTARISLLTFTVLTAAASAGEPLVSSAKYSSAGPASAPSRWRFGAAYAPLVGLKTDFTGLGTFNNAFTPQPIGGGTNYNYDDGFVHVDSSGNLGGETWNWSYANDSQYNPAGDGSIAMSLSNSLADGDAREDGGLENGFEAFAYYDMGAVTIPALRERGATWGFRGGLHYARIDMRNSDSVSSNVETMTDLFDLGGTIPPLAPYTGSFSGPGPLIGDSPVDRSSAISGRALVTGSRDLDVHLTTFNFGGYLEVAVAPKFNLLLEGGISAAIASGDYDFESSTSIGGLGTRQSSGSDSGTSILPGFYLGLSGIYRLNESWGIHAAGRYQYMDEFDLESNGSGANLSFDSAFVLSLGAVYSF
jgi:hypothetical protein